ncbi:MAG: DUF364 domain-containing protein [Deltaproteobacteria bacterium]|jgi:uncharacterized protein (DUF4213/DUF364 family)|nr:DUF364 domain-containing protein [Deltaproteobacteria bacterium]
MILKDVIDSLDFNTRVRDIRVGMFHTAVLTRNCGLAASLPKDALKQSPPLVESPGFLLEITARELAEMAFSESILQAAIGVAGINSLIDIDESRCSELNASEIIAEKGRGKNVAIIGHFPFIPKTREIVRNLWVIEKNPKPGDYPEEKAKELIPEADVLAITGTAITNHTIEELLKLKNKNTYTIVLGDSAILSPVLFDYGVDAIAGTKVLDPDLALRCISQGANFRQVKGIRKLIMLKG